MSRALSLPLLLLSAGTLFAQDLRINELFCTVRSGRPDSTAWIELYNPGRTTVELHGWSLATATAVHRIDTAWTVPAQGFALLRCEVPGAPPVLHLNANGGSLLLIAPNGTSVKDIFSWKPIPAGTSVGRATDGTRSWGYFERPTPGTSNTASPAFATRTPPPVVGSASGTFTAGTPEGSVVHFTTDGTSPTITDRMYTGPVSVEAHVPVRARAFAPNALPSLERVVSDVPSDAMGLIVDPAFLWDPERGIYVTGAADNFTRKGTAWRRAAWVVWPHDTDEVARPVSLSIAGSGSRGLPKKNLKLRIDPTAEGERTIVLPDGTSFGEIGLRADATPHAFLRNLFMEQVARAAGARVDVQGGTPLPLYLNGIHWGTYRAMPPKDEEWASRLSGDRPVTVIAGPAGADADSTYGVLLNALRSDTALGRLSDIADVASLIELAAFDLWMGRADHDLNVRCWRPQEKGGRWRWILYDMDLWAPPQEWTVSRMLSADDLEAPFLARLLADTALTDALLERVASLQATVLSPQHGLLLADSIYFANKDLMEADHARWNAEMRVPLPAEGHAALRDHILQRGDALAGQLAKATGRTLRSLEVEVKPLHGGEVRLDDLFLTDASSKVRLFSGTLPTFTAVPAPGMEFAGWEDRPDRSAELRIDPMRTKRLRALFRPVGLSRQGGLQQRGE